MNIKPIKSKKDYEKAIERLEAIFDAKKGSVEGDELEVLQFLLTIMKMNIFRLTFPTRLKQLSSEWNKWDIIKQIWQKLLA